VKRGRPREVQNPVRVSLSVEAEQYDLLYRLSQLTGESIQKIIRRRAFIALTNGVMATTSAQ
jgi:hypothetical protein